MTTSSHTTNLNIRDGNHHMLRILTKYAKGLHVCHINAQSLGRKLDEFQYLFENSGVDCVCISETWFQPDVPDLTYSINGYTIFRYDRIFIEITCNGNKAMIGCKYRPHSRVDLDPLISNLQEITVSYNNIFLAGDFKVTF